MQKLVSITVGLALGLCLGALLRAARLPDHPDHSAHGAAPARGSAAPAPTAEHGAHAAPAPAAEQAGRAAGPASEHAGHGGVAPAGGAAPAGPAAGSNAAMEQPAPPASAGPLEVDLANERCPVMGGAAKESIYVVWRGVRVRFCCGGCDEDFLANPEALLAEAGVDPTLALEVAARLVDATPAQRAAVCEEYGHRVRIVPAAEGAR